MNWVDLLVLIVLALSGLTGFVRGMVREILGLAAWVGAGIVAFLLFPSVQGMARRSIGNPDIADPLAFGVVFLIVLIALSLIARGLSDAVRKSGLGSLDRTLGLVFGLARGALLVVTAYIFGSVAMPVETWPQPVLEARTLPTIYRGAEWLVGFIPPDYRPVIGAPPSGRQATADALLRAAPQGRAVGPRTVRN